MCSNFYLYNRIVAFWCLYITSIYSICFWLVSSIQETDIRIGWFRRDDKMWGWNVYNSRCKNVSVNMGLQINCLQDNWDCKYHYEPPLSCYTNLTLFYELNIFQNLTLSRGWSWKKNTNWRLVAIPGISTLVYSGLSVNSRQWIQQMILNPVFK